MSSETDESLITLFEDANLLAVHKPAGIPFHCDDLLQGIVQKVRLQFESEQLFPVHRLDKMTSGLMVFAKTQASNKAISEMLQNKTIEKYYLALSTKKPGKKQGAVAGDMVKGRRGSYLLRREKTNPAVTRFFAKALDPMLNKDTELSTKEGYWLFALKPETGKTHQLRVALKSLASPILGDERYSGMKADRGYLHAYKMCFDLFGQRYDITDENFQGEAFSLTSLSESNDFRLPQKLNWPKAAFKLDNKQT
ncbi:MULTISPECIES: pseudouridine synthase [unclassified Oleiphilus]|nr:MULTISPECIES: pseudouridine synthase [unclassified Oleiphilus]KZY43672.1 hypothetical protein A3732_13895 [Oleiphilus sp. HI0050]KZZ31607.1 hypothetical protein A3756_06780 [Oleiphilus sp. HI0086]KZZ36160.1 hypothetical protein A3757_14265 [Oleiphilus sp. HI0117]KZZ55126.1 hypothetical protein A3761_12720 [Oleiphilus sp. HI0123]